ncbi:hypothetical protein INH39_07540 [Massilia violaceinigra]|uniref:Uncharacterized protein n=1 Tax=Massilia violaceinigra TaxID=2045208 RepID=A0ABY4A9P8_9BURK|nr:hypothetical protein [Massilia violaceinigra]UOD31536.1 hypothetical protein INH39_07540 [Massilia violaceinigra]
MPKIAHERNRKAGFAIFCSINTRLSEVINFHRQFGRRQFSVRKAPEKVWRWPGCGVWNTGIDAFRPYLKPSKIRKNDGPILIKEKNMNIKGNKRSFKLRFVIKHPDIPMDVISAKLGLLPHHGYSAGDSRITPKENSLPGFNIGTFWGYNPNIADELHFFDASTKFARSMIIHSDFLTSVVNSGGVVGLYIDVLQPKNVGDILRPADMMLFASLGITLGIEFFP